MTLKIVGATKADWKIIIPEISPDKKINMELIGNYFPENFGCCFSTKAFTAFL